MSKVIVPILAFEKHEMPMPWVDPGIMVLPIDSPAKHDSPIFVNIEPLSNANIAGGLCDEGIDDKQDLHNTPTDAGHQIDFKTQPLKRFLLILLSLEPPSIPSTSTSPLKKQDALRPSTDAGIHIDLIR
jgi:hypothetical protein